MSDERPVSGALEREVLAQVRRQSLVLWLDRDGAFTAFADELAARHATGGFPFPVVGFRGSFLELLLLLEPFGSGLDRPPLVVHLPGLNETSIRATPLLELWELGTSFRRSLETLIREAATARVAPAEVDRFLAGQPSLAQADAWLASAVTRGTLGLASALREFGPRLLAEALGRPGSSLALRVTSPEDLAALRAYLHTLTGVDAAWLDWFGGGLEDLSLDGTLGALAAWVLCVEYVHDLNRPAHLAELRRLRDLSVPLVAACRDLVLTVRREYPDAYEKLADEVSTSLAEELAAIAPEDLGRIDTFREEENRVLAGAVEALLRGEWSRARSWCEARHGDCSFWLSRDQVRRWAWSLVEEAATLGETLGRHPRPFDGIRTLEEAAERYAATAFEVDRAHRRFEQRRLALLEPRLPHFGRLQEVLGSLRRAHRRWADDLARAFARLCQEHGFLPPSSLRQRNIHDQVVHPLTQTGDKVAVFLVDAFRFEMATELVEQLRGAGTVVDLRPRLAELPTITPVGMNALAPVADGERMVVVKRFQGFKSGEKTVSAPAHRANAMGLRTGGQPALLLDLSEVCETSTAELTRKVRPHTLVVVHSREIDDAGEANVGLPTFDSTLRQLEAAFHHLQLAGVKSFVFTADHGFLLQDETTHVAPYGKVGDASRRHILDAHARAEDGMVNVSLSSLGYEGLAGYLLFRDDTAVFKTGVSGATFVHGGNSPQERIIPVLTITRKIREPSGHAALAIQVEPLDDVLGNHRLRLRVVHAPGTLGFAATRHAGLALRVPGRDDVRVTVKDRAGPAELRAGRLVVPVGDAWSEVFFALEGPADERVRVEVFHADNVAEVRAAQPEAWYTVNGTTAGAVPPRPTQAWADAIADEGVRKVFLHIARHGAITEQEITVFLGTPRAFRRFSGELEQYLARLPFGVRIEPGESGKRYVKDGSR